MCHFQLTDALLPPLSFLCGNMLILWSLTSHYMRKRYLCEERVSPLDAGFSPLAYAEEGVIS